MTERRGESSRKKTVKQKERDKNKGKKTITCVDDVVSK